MTITDAETGAYTYMPDADYKGSDSFDFVANDGDDSEPATISITVTSVDDEPDAVADTASVDEDDSVDINVLANDDLGNNPAIGDQPVTVTIDSNPANGSVGVVANVITYTPDPDFDGPSDSFSYEVTDANGDHDSATVTVTVNPVNDAPVANGGTDSTDEDTAISDGQVTGSDTENDDLTFSLVDDVTNGTLVLDQDGSFTYTPDADWNGTDTFTFLANDGDLDSEVAATITITVGAVNDAPVANGGTDSTDEDTAISDRQVTGSDTEGDDLTFSLVDDVTNGTLVLDHANGSFTYTPDADWNGTDSFTFLANDGDLDNRPPPPSPSPSAPSTTPRWPMAAPTAPTKTRPSATDRSPARTPGRRHLTSLAGRRRHQRHPGHQPGRVLHLHARRRLERPGQLHLPRQRR